MPDERVDEGEFFGHWLCDGKWIQFPFAHRLVNDVEGRRQRKPLGKDIGHRCFCREIDAGVGGKRRDDLGGECVICWTGHAESVGSGGLQSIGDMQIMGEGLGEILPRMGRRILRDEVAAPVGSWPPVVAGQRCSVVLPLVAEHDSERRELLAVAHQSLPKIVADLMTRMPEHCAIWLAEKHPQVFSMRIRRLGEIDGDDAIQMSDHHLLVVCARREVEGETTIGLLAVTHDWQAEFVELKDEPSFGVRCVHDVSVVCLVAGVRARAREVAGIAVVVRSWLVVIQPIASDVEVATQTPAVSVSVDVCSGLEAYDGTLGPRVGEWTMAVRATLIVEIHDVAACRAGENPHDPTISGGLCCTHTDRAL